MEYRIIMATLIAVSASLTAVSGEAWCPKKESVQTAITTAKCDREPFLGYSCSIKIPGRDRQGNETAFKKEWNFIPRNDELVNGQFKFKDIKILEGDNHAKEEKFNLICDYQIETSSKSIRSLRLTRESESLKKAEEDRKIAEAIKASDERKKLEPAPKPSLVPTPVQQQTKTISPNASLAFKLMVYTTRWANAFCKGGIMVSSIRASSGKYCKEPAKAWLAEGVCSQGNIEGYNSSHCHDEAQKIVKEGKLDVMGAEYVNGDGLANLCKFIAGLIGPAGFSEQDCKNLKP